MGLFSKKRKGATIAGGSDVERRSFDHLPEGDIKVRRKRKPKPDWAARLMWIILWFLFIIFVVVVSLYAFIKGTEFGQVNADRHLFGRESPWFIGSQDRLLQPTAIATSENVFEAWTREVKKRLVVERKIKSISLSDSLIGDPSDHIFLGVFERDELNRKNEAALHFYIALANGHPDAYRLYNSLNVPSADYEALYQRFIALHELNGDEGLERLGQYYLGRDSFRIANRMRTDLRFGQPNDYVWPRQEESENLAYIHFQMASICGLASAYEWREETANFYKFTEDREKSLKVRANAQLKELADRYTKRRGYAGQDAYCKREHLDNVFDELTDLYTSLSSYDYEEDLEYWNGGHPCDETGHDYTDVECDEFDYYMDEGGTFSLIIQVPTFRELIDEISDTRGGYRSRSRLLDRIFPGRGRGVGRGGRGGGRASASPAYRNNPGGSVADPRNFPEGKFEHDCGVPGDENYDECITEWNDSASDRRLSNAACHDDASRQFNLGEADMAVGRTVNARNRFERAISIGRECQSEYAIRAGKRISALNLTCEYTPRSLARISRGYYNNPEGGAIIDLPSRQRALRAKGHYSGTVDGKYGPGTRESVKRFQRELGFSESGDLTPIETVYLICSAAETHADLKSINTLGIMYLAGLGVVQNTDRGIQWLTQAAERDNEDAMYNLALVYGTETIVNSYRLCGNVENIARADSWLEQAANNGHPPARRLVELFGSLPPSERWQKIREELQLNDFYLDRLEPVGEACNPNP